MTERRFIRPAVVLAVLTIALGVLLLSGARSVLGQAAPATDTPTATSIGAAPETPPPDEAPLTPTPLVAAHGAGFRGSVTINGEPAPHGTPIEALVGDVVCGTTMTSGQRYGITVNAGFGVGNQFQEGCGSNGVTVVFRSGERIANERGQFLGGVIQTLHLTFGQALAPTATAPPALPDTGSGTPGSGADFTPGLLWVLLGVAIAGLMAALAGRRVTR